MIDVGLKKKLKVAVRKGHNEVVRGASGIIDEVNENTKVLKEVISLLKNIKNVEVIDCSSGRDCNTQNSDLRYGVNKANNNNVDVFVSIHFNNAYKQYKGTIGSEVLVYDKPSTRAVAVQKNLIALGFKDRGCKKRDDLYELRATLMESMIIEVCFVEATGDVDLYKKVGVKSIAKAIVEGIVGAKIGNSETSKPEKPSKPNKETYEDYITGTDVKTLQKELNSQYNAGLSVDGYFGDKTIAKLVVVRRGAKGNITKVAQKRLIAKKFSVGQAGADGDFGKGTENAVKELQKVNKLSIDGVIGVNTWKSLYRK